MDADQFKIFMDDTKAHLEKVVKETVNGKIDRLHKEVVKMDETQGAKIEEIRKNTQDVVDLYKTSTKIGNGIILISKFVAALATIFGIGWAFVKFVVLASIPK